MILAQFADKAGGPAIRELLEIRWEGSVNALGTQFSEHMASGEPIWPALAADVVVGGLPKIISETNDKPDSATWAEVRDAAPKVLVSKVPQVVHLCGRRCARQVR